MQWNLTTFQAFYCNRSEHWPLPYSDTYTLLAAPRSFHTLQFWFPLFSEWSCSLQMIARHSPKKCEHALTQAAKIFHTVIFSAVKGKTILVLHKNLWSVTVQYLEFMWMHSGPFTIFAWHLDKFSFWVQRKKNSEVCSIPLWALQRREITFTLHLIPLLLLQG